MMNVVSLNEFKELQEMRRSVESYGYYLKTLENSQLETEVNFLLEEFSGDRYGKDFFKKGQLILNEISKRAEPSVRARIEVLNQETLKLL